MKGVRFPFKLLKKLYQFIGLNHELPDLRHGVLNVPNRVHEDNQPTLITHVEEGDFEVCVFDEDVVKGAEEVIGELSSPLSNLEEA